MGLVNALQIFQRQMDNLFKDYFELQDHIVEKIHFFRRTQGQEAIAKLLESC